MKKETVQIALGRPAHREHFVLFEGNTPFRPKKVELKKRYKRKPKHPSRDW